MTVSEIELLLRSLDDSWSEEKWSRLPPDGNRYEVIDGVLYCATVPTFRHAQVMANLALQSHAALEADRGAITVLGPVGLVISPTVIVQPDFLAFRADRRSLIAEDGYIRGVPNLIAEVLSDAHTEYETQIKHAAYARAGVP